MATVLKTAVEKKPWASLIAESVSAIEAKERQVGLEHLGALVDNSPSVRTYADGSSIVYNANAAAAYRVEGAIAQKWRDLGGLSWGTPRSDEEGLNDGRGRRTSFDVGKEIYWTPQTGACAILGAIAHRWHQLGGQTSYLGYPISDELDFVEAGKTNSFERGNIFWWADTGALDLTDVVVRIAGLRCFGETDSDQLSTSDEPYVVAVVRTSTGLSTVRTPIFEDVDNGETRSCDVEVYRGKPTGLALTPMVLEHDTGNPDTYKKQIEKAAMAVHGVGTAALLLIPVIGWAAAAIAGPIGAIAMPALAGAISDALDSGDDLIGSYNLFLSPKDLITAACLRPNQEDYGLITNVSTPAIGGLGATYRVFFEVARIGG